LDARIAIKWLNYNIKRKTLPYNHETTPTNAKAATAGNNIHRVTELNHKPVKKKSKNLS